MSDSEYFDDYKTPGPPPIPEDRCEKCRYESASLSKQPGKLYCAWHGKHVLPNDPACEDYWVKKKIAEQEWNDKKKRGDVI